MLPTNIPGYVQGFRFDDTDADAYDSDNDIVLDQAGFKDFAYGGHVSNNCELLAGTAAFLDVHTNSRRGLLVDGASFWKFLPVAPWEHSGIIACKIFGGSGGITVTPFLQGDAASSTSNARIVLQQFGAQKLLRFQTASGLASAQMASPSAAAMVIAAYAVSQQTGLWYVTTDGITVTTGAITTSAVNGNAAALTGTTATTSQVAMRGTYWVIGDLLNDRTPNAQADQKNQLHLCEYHTFNGNILVGNLSEVKDFIDNRVAYYG